MPLFEVHTTEMQRSKVIYLVIAKDGEAAESKALVGDVLGEQGRDIMSAHQREVTDIVLVEQLEAGVNRQGIEVSSTRRRPKRAEGKRDEPPWQADQIAWHKEFGAAAIRQGWSLFDCTNEVQLQRDDDLDAFPDDESCARFVKERAAGGDAGALAAIALLKKHDQPDFLLWKF